MAIVFLFAFLCLSVTISNYNDHYYNLLSGVMDLRMASIISTLKDYESCAVEISINSDLQSYLSTLKDNNDALRITTSNSIRTVLSKQVSGYGNVNTVVVVPADKSAGVFQTLNNALDPSAYMALVDKLKDTDHKMWITDYCDEGRLIYVCRINRVKNVKLDTIGYVLIDVLVQGALSQAVMKNRTCRQHCNFRHFQHSNFPDWKRHGFPAFWKKVLSKRN